MVLGRIDPDSPIEACNQVLLQTPALFRLAMSKGEQIRATAFR